MIARRTLGLLLLLPFFPIGCGESGSAPTAPNASAVTPVDKVVPGKESRPPGVVAGKVSKRARPARDSVPGAATP
jgi:hypothetical protein